MTCVTIAVKRWETRRDHGKETSIPCACVRRGRRERRFGYGVVAGCDFTHDADSADGGARRVALRFAARGWATSRFFVRPHGIGSARSMGGSRRVGRPPRPPPPPPAPQPPPRPPAPPGGPP